MAHLGLGEIGVFSFFKKSVFELHRPVVLNSECLQHHSEHPHLCLIAAEGASFVKSSLFFWQSKFDQDMLAWQPNYGVYGHNDGVCLVQDGDSGDPSDIDNDCANRIGEKMSAAAQHLWQTKPNIA